MYTDSYIVDENNLKIGTWKDDKNKSLNTHIWSSNYITDGLDDVIKFLIHKCTINNASSVLFKKSELFDSVDFNKLQQLKNVGDVFVYSSVLLSSKVGYISDSLNFYRLHSVNFTKKNMVNVNFYLERLKVLKFILEKIDLDLLTKHKIKFIQDSIKNFFKKNIFKLLEFKEFQKTYSFLDFLKERKILSLKQIKILKFNFKLYLLIGYFSNYRAKKILKSKIEHI